MKSFFSLLFLFLGFSNAQSINPVKISLPTSTVEMVAGEQRMVMLTVDIESPWHINSHIPNDESLIATKVSASGNGISLGKTNFPNPHDVTFSFSEQPVSVFEGKIDITLTLTAEKNAIAGKQPVTVKLNYQACNDQTCLAPKTVSATVEVNVNATASSPAYTVQPDRTENRIVEQPQEQAISEPLQTYGGAPASAVEDNTLASTLEKSGLAVSLLLIFLGGLALNLTPCVYPLIPITVGYFGGQSEGRTSKLFLLGVLYMLGMALTYSVIGVVTSMSGALFGTLLQNISVIIGIAVLFVVLALSQFGVYEFTLPSSWMAAAGGAKGGTFGAFFMGLTMGIVAAPCIGPFVLGLVTFVAAKGDPFQGFLMFFILSLGLGFPYLILALFSGKIKNLPRSGEWMEGVKHLFGFIMLGMALYFLDPILPKAVRSFVLPVFGIIAASILLFIDKRGNSVKGFRTVKIALSLIITAVSIYAMIPVQKHSPEWKTFSQASFETSLKNNEAMIIDFYADWCIPCKELDALTFSDRRVVEQSQKFHMYKADMTQSDSPETAVLAKRFHIKGVPTIVIIDANGNVVERITGFVNAEVFLEKIQGAL
ncbi:MAG: protein-disulfide reductase DsbD [Bacteriovoracaceae bacterium]|nr:protein-disulfide reductase DsbD [Bacteroidota bacterium]